MSESEQAAGREMRIYTIGHSNHPLERFLELLRQHQVGVVVDIRSSPYSGYAAQFNRETLDSWLAAGGIKYLFLGEMLGGKPEGEEFYDEDGHVLYGRVAESWAFQEGLERLLTGVTDCPATLLCGEEDPANCHRRRLVGRVLGERGVEVLHIRGDGRVESEEELAKAEEFRKNKGQMSLFETEEPGEWKSTQSVSPRKAQRSSSES